MTKGELAKKYFLEGYNCSQSVLLAFCDDLGFDKSTAEMISAPFGGGMGRLREVCGAVSGMFMVLGLSIGENSTDRDNKKQIYTSVQKLAEEFKKENGSIICRELLGLRTNGRDKPEPQERTENYYRTRPCAELCKFAAELVDGFLVTAAENE